MRRNLSTELLLIVCWLMLVFMNWRIEACLRAFVQFSILFANWKRRADEQRFDEALEKLQHEKNEHFKALTTAIDEFKKAKAELEAALPMRETVCSFGDQVLLSCGHVVNIQGASESLRKFLEKKMTCVACAEDNDKKAKGNG